MDIDAVTGSGGTLVLGGRTLLLSRLTMGSIGKITAWLKERIPRPYQVAAEKLLDLAPIREVDPEGYQKAREEILLEARESSKKGKLSDEDMVNEAMQSLDGIAMLTWLSIRQEHPDLTYEWVQQALEHEDLLSIYKKINETNKDLEAHLPKN